MESLPLAPYAAHRRTELLALYRKLQAEIMLRDQIDYQEFCRRGQMRQKSGAACAGMPEVGHSPAIQ